MSTLKDLAIVANAEWAALTTAGVCAYDNTLSNVATGFTFPT